MSSEYAAAIERGEEGRAVRLVFARVPDTVATVSVPCKRPSCGNPVTPQERRRGEPRVYCSPACKTRHWDETHPRLPNPEQARLDFTPAASELAHAIRGRESKAQRILARLRQGPATTWQLAQTGGIRFGARLLELRRAGHRITTVEHADHAVYRLEGE